MGRDDRAAKGCVRVCVLSLSEERGRQTAKVCCCHWCLQSVTEITANVAVPKKALVSDLIGPGSETDCVYSEVIGSGSEEEERRSCDIYEFRLTLFLSGASVCVCVRETVFEAAVFAEVVQCFPPSNYGLRDCVCGSIHVRVWGGEKKERKKEKKKERKKEKKTCVNEFEQLQFETMASVPFTHLIGGPTDTSGSGRSLEDAAALRWHLRNKTKKQKGKMTAVVLIMS